MRLKAWLSGEFDRDWEAELDACELDAGDSLLLEDILKFKTWTIQTSACQVQTMV